MPTHSVYLFFCPAPSCTTPTQSTKLQTSREGLWKTDKSVRAPKSQREEVLLGKVGGRWNGEHAGQLCRRGQRERETGSEPRSGSETLFIESWNCQEINRNLMLMRGYSYGTFTSRYGKNLPGVTSVGAHTKWQRHKNTISSRLAPEFNTLQCAREQGTKSTWQRSQLEA